MLDHRILDRSLTIEVLSGIPFTNYFCYITNKNAHEIRGHFHFIYYPAFISIRDFEQQWGWLFFHSVVLATGT
jgi:hypothetical protein